jgi:hypothetical protein
MGRQRVGIFFQDGGVRAGKGFWMYKWKDLGPNWPILTEIFIAWVQHSKNGAFFQILQFSSFLLMCKYWCNNENLTEKSSMIGSENFEEIPAEECSRYCFSIKIFSKCKNLH